MHKEVTKYSHRIISRFFCFESNRSKDILAKGNL